MHTILKFFQKKRYLEENVRLIHVCLGTTIGTCQGACMQSQAENWEAWLASIWDNKFVLLAKNDIGKTFPFWDS